MAQARAQRAAYRAQAAGARRRVDLAKPAAKQAVAKADSMPSSTSVGMTPSYHTGLDGETFVSNDEPYAAAAGSPSFPTEDSSYNEEDSLFYGERRPAYKDPPRPPRLHGASPGVTSREGPRDMKKPSPQIICYTCYKVEDHINPDCSMKVRDVSLVLHNFENLTAALTVCSGGGIPARRSPPQFRC